ncbi:MAG: hypothetical protein SVU88_02295 [Candidatus Nanohaloarchaea archaeon]|nr:hypothetical protein [Candidatus Nanohaloarchaea archaeon]
MTFLFLGMDGMDHELADHFGVTHADDDHPVHLKRLEQDMPEHLADEPGERRDVGWWTFYLWGAIAAGRIDTPHMEIEHPSPDDLKYPDKEGYFAWDAVDGDVRVVNWPISLPEYQEDCGYFRGDRISTDYDQLEPFLLLMEINKAIERNYDAVFAATRIVDTHQHAATEPGNYNAQGYDHFAEGFTGHGFEELHEIMVDATEWAADPDAEQPAEAVEARESIIDAVLNWLEGVYTQADDIIKGVNWEGVEDHVIVSDHGFDRLGAGDVKSHGPAAVISSSLGEWENMSEFIPGWRGEALERIEAHDPGETVEVDQEEEIQRRLRELGYRV